MDIWYIYIWPIQKVAKDWLPWIWPAFFNTYILYIYCVYIYNICMYDYVWLWVNWVKRKGLQFVTTLELQRAELRTQGNQQEFGKKNRPKEETCLVSMDLVRILGPSPPPPLPLLPALVTPALASLRRCEQRSEQIHCSLIYWIWLKMQDPRKSFWHLCHLCPENVSHMFLFACDHFGWFGRLIV